MTPFTSDSAADMAVIGTISNSRIVTGSRRVLAAGVAILIIACSYVFLVPVGLPYDEPSHWGYVRHVAVHWSLPVLGDPSVGYEAQMGPVAYFLDAVVLDGWKLMGGMDSTGVFVVRIFGLLPLAALYMGMVRLMSGLLPAAAPEVVRLGCAIAVLNPMLIAMSMSVQNDTLAIAAAVWLLLVISRGLVGTASIAIAGFLAGGAVLTKLSVLPVIGVAVAWPAITQGWRGLRRSVAVSLVALMCCGWWFLRNITLYHDPTARSAVPRADVEFQPLGWHGTSTLLQLARSATAYLWLPVEYYRNLISSPTIVDVVMVLGTLGICVCGGLSLAYSSNLLPVLPILVGVVSLAAWASTAVFVQAVAFRTAYGILPLYSALAIVALTRHQRRHPRLTIWIAGLALVSLHVWTLASLSSVSYAPGLSTN